MSTTNTTSATLTIYVPETTEAALQNLAETTGRVELIAVLHGAQRWPDSFP